MECYQMAHLSTCVGNFLSFGARECGTGSPRTLHLLVGKTCKNNTQMELANQHFANEDT